VAMGTVVWCAACRAAPRPPEAITFYLQLICGDNETVAPAPTAQRIGPRLSERLRSVFKWKGYWELKRDSVSLGPGQKVRRKLCSTREVEIELLGTDRMKLRVYSKGELTRSRIESATAAFSVIGGEEGERSCWFIVVRRDEPQRADEQKIGTASR
jgi:hypothetical protein